MAATVGNCLLATVVPRRSNSANRQLCYWPITRSSPSSVALDLIKRSRLIKINSSLISSKDYNLEHAESKDLIKSDDVGPPRWLTPLESESRLTASPLLLFLPGIDGAGHGLKLHHKRLAEIFDVRCLHIPMADQTPLPGNNKLNEVIYFFPSHQLFDLLDLVKMVESAIMSEHERAPKRPIYLVGESLGASLALVVAARNPDIDIVLILANPATSFSKSLLQNVWPLSDMIQKQLQAGVPRAMSSITVETVLWKLKLIHDMQNYLNSHIHAVKAQTLILKSGKDVLLSSLMEVMVGESIYLQDERFDLVAVIKRTNYYRRGASYDYVTDFLPPTTSELKAIFEEISWTDVAFNPVMLSTMDDGKIVRGLAGIPSEGPVLLVDLSVYDLLRAVGGFPVSATNLYRLLSMKSHVILFPGGVREAFHHKGEEYKLIWPAEPEFVRMAARFGATIIPFAGVGEDDIIELLLDCDDQMKIPALKDFIEGLNNETVRLRGAVEGEVAKQYLYYPVFLPKLPGRAYFLFGKPISTKGRDDILRNKDKACEMYLEVQNEIEKCIAFLKKKREKDPYRNLLDRLAYQSSNGFHSEVPTFEI
ncbi:hypothetical protein DH2020_012972 [Rehmannia glutinosa]|uniref:Serine aminopeptidase S33 domain-containing protein n=1 Tax=Rehmannia glutinosa TaxID=99300 RepID=A0ABR0X231_REHGL